MRLLGFCLLVAVLAAITTAQSSFTPPVPSTLNCWLERLNRNFGTWKPTCVYFRWYAYEQCDAFGNCWCVSSRTGQPHSYVPHARKTVDCRKSVLECELTEIYSNCASYCPNTCENRNKPRICIAACRQGCTCPSGTVDKNGVCVSEEECPPTCNDTLNEVYRECAPPCDATCDDPKKLCSLQESCNKRCACADGYVRNDEGVCVEVKQCPAPEPTVPECPGNQIYSNCASYCPTTCSNLNQPIACITLCRQGCTCPSGMVDNGGVCVYEENCPPICDQTLNEEYRECAPPCDATCDEPQKLCSLQESCNKRCACADGYVRNDEGVCVEVEQCPAPEPTVPVCPENQVYSECAGCDRRCDERDILMICTLECKQKCTCQSGLYLDGERCVEEIECPPVCNASLNEAYSSCAPPCDATCDEPQKFCSLQESCNKRCACDKEQVRNSKGVCVNADQCPQKDSGSSVTCETYSTGDLSYVPQCDENGNFNTTQCEEDMCFCVDKMSGNILEGTRRPIEIFNLECSLLGDCPGKMTFNSCATACPETCDDPLPRCTRNCAIDCVCPPGHVRRAGDDMTCVPIDLCPAPHSCPYKRALSPTVQCDIFGYFEPRQCAEDDMCWCVDRDGVKIINTEAGINSFTPDTCAQARDCNSLSGMQWTFCLPRCFGTCFDKSPLCDPPEECTPGCQCKEGYYVEEDFGECVLEPECPQLQDENAITGCNLDLGEIFNVCAATCDATCDEPLKPCSLTKICLQKCSCPKGHLRSPDNVCIPAAECPVTQQESEGRESQVNCTEETIKIKSKRLQDDFIPECDVNDNEKYLPIQCYGFLLECWCVNETTGKEIPNTRHAQFSSETFDCNDPDAMNLSSLPGPLAPIPDVAGPES
ncbi:zonadhesin-like isoform X2 [Clavelina lepadiformis]|uniref:zonadhesin-like isoform X2 n=1 Tax=Clavelina lepadiformis TaxID=159417 RepID=UPI004042E3F2